MGAGSVNPSHDKGADKFSTDRPFSKAFWPEIPALYRSPSNTFACHRPPATHGLGQLRLKPPHPEGCLDPMAFGTC